MEKEKYKIEDSIRAILKQLPPQLQLEAEAEQSKARSSARAGDWLARRHRRQNGLELTVVTGSLYLSERDRKTLKPGEILSTEKTDDGSIDVRDLEGHGVGRVINPTPLRYNEFVQGLERCYGRASLSVEFLHLHGEETHSDGVYAWLVVKVRTETADAQRSSEPGTRGF